MNNPYEVLGVSKDASIEEVKEAYKTLAKQYYGFNDEHSVEKLRELDEAYDKIMNNSGYNYDGVLKEVRLSIRNGNIKNADELLSTVPEENRTAEWYFLSGNINRKRGYFESAVNDFATAHDMDPDNAEYRSAYENFNTRRSTNYRTTNPEQEMGCSVCSVCQAMICAEICCNCCNCC